MVRLTGAALGFLAFAIAIFVGISTGNTAEVILIRAIRAMFGFFALGLVVGWVAYRVIDEHALKHHRELFPEGEMPSGSPDSPQGESGAGLAG